MKTATIVQRQKSIENLQARWLAMLEQLDDEELQSVQRTRWPFRDRPFGVVVAWANIELTRMPPR